MKETGIKLGDLEYTNCQGRDKHVDSLAIQKIWKLAIR